MPNGFLEIQYFPPEFPTNFPKSMHIKLFSANYSIFAIIYNTRGIHQVSPASTCRLLPWQQNSTLHTCMQRIQPDSR